jgi:hypothetical protein
MRTVVRLPRVGRTVRRLIAAALGLLIAGCAAAPPPVPPAPPPIPASAPAPAPTAAPKPEVSRSPEWITARIAELETTRGKGKDADPKGALALELALLYSDPGNPAPDYAKALAMMRTYLELSASGAPDAETGRIAGLLEAIDRLGRLLREAKTHEKELSGQIQALQARVAEAEQRDAAAKKREQELQAQIQTLQQRIEQLQRLDLEMERRRRSVR